MDGEKRYGDEKREKNKGGVVRRKERKKENR